MMLLMPVQCDAFIEPPPTPALVEYTFSAAPPIRSVTETRRDERRGAMMSFLLDASTEDGDTIHPSAWTNFETLLRLLPDEFPATEPRVGRNGSICLDWDRDSGNQFSIMLLAADRIAFAAYFSGEKVNGTADFDVERLPIALSQAALRWIDRSRRRR